MQTRTRQYGDVVITVVALTSYLFTQTSAEQLNVGLYFLGYCEIFYVIQNEISINKLCHKVVFQYINHIAYGCWLHGCSTIVKIILLQEI